MQWRECNWHYNYSANQGASWVLNLGPKLFGQELRSQMCKFISLWVLGHPQNINLHTQTLWVPKHPQRYKFIHLTSQFLSKTVLAVGNRTIDPAHNCMSPLIIMGIGVSFVEVEAAGDHVVRNLSSSLYQLFIYHCMIYHYICHHPVPLLKARQNMCLVTLIGKVTV